MKKYEDFLKEIYISRFNCDEKDFKKFKESELFIDFENDVDLMVEDGISNLMDIYEPLIKREYFK